MVQAADMKGSSRKAMQNHSLEEQREACPSASVNIWMMVPAAPMVVATIRQPGRPAGRE